MIDNTPTYPRTLHSSQNRKNSTKETGTYESKYSIHNFNTKAILNSTLYKRHSTKQTKHSSHRRQETTDTEYNPTLQKECGVSEDLILTNAFSVCLNCFSRTNKKPLYQRRQVLHECLIQTRSIRSMIHEREIIKCI